MNIAALAFLVFAATPPASPAGNPAIRAFREACVEGALNLSPERGRILKDREITDFVDVLDWSRAKAQRTVVKLSEAPSSYLVLAEYKNLQPKSIARSCALVSATVSKQEAAAAYLENLPDKAVTPIWWPNMYVPIWVSDHPEQGYRKRLRFRDDGSIVLEVGMYPAAAAQMNAGTTKQ
jgi:hypothetical protein